jgi:selenocysteine lyase/cysteine desulfurase
VHACAEAKISCRNGSFLCSEQLKNEFSLQNPIEGLVRFSLAHYNIESEVKRLIKVLESIPGWL